MALAFGIVAIGCGDNTGGDDGSSNGPATKDGVDKPTGGKSDAWNWRNDPSRFHIDLEYNFENLPSEGASAKVAWAETYWPTYEDSINARWQGDDTLSPAEKYDKAFNDWTPPDGFMDLKPYDPNACTWDKEYYDDLGPAALWVSKNKGNWRSHNGVDDDNDGVADKDECGYGEDKDRDGVETWWGVCHAWTPSAILEDEPLGPVTRNGVTFDVSDLKALLIMQYDSSSAYMIGDRCNEADVERDDTGRINDEGCRDVNAGAFHLIVTNFLGIHKRALAEDRVYNYEVWNQPVTGYTIDEQKEISLSDVQELLNTDKPDESGLPQNQDETDGVLRVANEASETDLSDRVGLRGDEVDAILAYRAGEDGMAGTSDDATFETVDDIMNTDPLGEKSVASMLSWARDQGWAPELEPAIYSYNKDAARFVEVRLTLEYVSESSPSKEPTSPNIDRYTRSERYHYILELDEDGKIIGGEWVGSSITTHPDFLWLPTAPGGGDPNIDLDTVREMIAESRGGGSNDNGGTDAATSYDAEDTPVDIPDADVDGASSEITVNDSGKIDHLKVAVNIEHTYKGDLLVQLVKTGDHPVTATLFDGYKAENRWEDNVVLDDVEVPGFEGAQLNGTWQLHVVDSLNGDTGQIKSWSLKPTMAE